MSSMVDLSQICTNAVHRGGEPFWKVTRHSMSKPNGLLNVILLIFNVVKAVNTKAAVKAATKQTGGTLDYFITFPSKSEIEKN